MKEGASTKRSAYRSTSNDPGQVPLAALILTKYLTHLPAPLSRFRRIRPRKNHREITRSREAFRHRLGPIDEKWFPHRPRNSAQGSLDKPGRAGLEYHSPADGLVPDFFDCFSLGGGTALKPTEGEYGVHFGVVKGSIAHRREKTLSKLHLRSTSQ